MTAPCDTDATGVELGQKVDVFQAGSGLDDHSEEDGGGPQCEMSHLCLQHPHFDSIFRALFSAS